MDREQSRLNHALSGLEQLAFAPVNGAVQLLAQAQSLEPDQIDALDLFPVSEIKQNKDGYLEIKFFDRLKAFELLISQAESSDTPKTVSSFYGALESAAKSACDADAV